MSMVTSESSTDEMGDIIPSSSDEECCMMMMRVGNKGCQVFHALKWCCSCWALLGAVGQQIIQNGK